MNDMLDPPLWTGVTEIPLDSITLDPELQPRAALDRTTWEHYLYLLGDGTVLPPVLIINDGEKLWLTDGFHRWHAHKAIGVETISASVESGTRRDALLASLRANATHGRQREPADYRKAYETACRHNLVSAEDVEAVHRVINCSMRLAYDLTEVARQRAEQERNELIAAKKAEGMSNRQIARETGVSVGTVSNKTRDQKLQPAETDRPDTPARKPAGQAEYEDMTSERGERWWGALRALQHVVKQSAVSDLMADRYPGIGHVFEPALREAHVWINELHGKYFDGE